MYFNVAQPHDSVQKVHTVFTLTSHIIAWLQQSHEHKRHLLRFFLDFLLICFIAFSYQYFLCITSASSLYLFCFSSLVALLWFWLLTLVEVFLYFYGWKKSWWSKPKRTLGNSSWRRRRKRKPQPKLTWAILSTSHIEALKSSDSQCF